jgi:hypothetical protein
MTLRSKKSERIKDNEVAIQNLSKVDKFQYRRVIDLEHHLQPEIPFQCKMTNKDNR